MSKSYRTLVSVQCHNELKHINTVAKCGKSKRVNG